MLAILKNEMEQLRRLDASVSKPGTIVSIILGVIGTLLLGGGMSCTMVWKEELFIQGIILGAIGIVCIIAAYPIYLHITGKQRKKLAPEIIRLTDELTNGQ